MKIILAAVFLAGGLYAANAVAATSQPTSQTEPFKRGQEPFQKGQQQQAPPQPVLNGQPGVARVPFNNNGNPMAPPVGIAPQH